MKKIIAHIDLDAFFASVEEREKPYLKGLPIVVGADPKGGLGRGVVSTASYRARKYGIHSAMPIKKAWQACVEAKKRGEAECVFITSGFRKYSIASKEVFTIVKKYSPHIEQTSVDEGYLDFSHLRSFKRAKEVGEKLRKEIQKKTKLTASIGIGPSKLIAKIASDYQKPNGLTVVTPAHVHRFLAPLPVRKIPGVGKVAQQKLNARGIETVSDLQSHSWEEMEKMFGKWGFSLYERIRGVDMRDVEPEPAIRKSVGKHHTFAEDTLDMKFLFKEITALSTEVHGVFLKKKFSSFRTVVLTIRFDDFSTYTRSSTAEKPLSSVKDIELKGVKLLLPFFEKTNNPQEKKVRLLGLRVEHLA